MADFLCIVKTEVMKTIFALLILLTMKPLFSQSYHHQWKQECLSRLEQTPHMRILEESDLDSLPEPVKKYIRYTGAVGKPVVSNIHLVFTGWFKTAPERPYARFRAEQYNFFDAPARFYYMTLRQSGIKARGLHVYKNAAASMRIRVAGLFTVADASGPIMDQSETVTVFNDMCLMAPAALAFAPVEWEVIDSLTVNATFYNGEQSVMATLFFNETGQLIDFSSDDRLASSDGKTYEKYRWSTPVRAYREINGRMIPSYGEAIWHRPDGPLVYGRFELQEAHFNSNKLQ